MGRRGRIRVRGWVAADGQTAAPQKSRRSCRRRPRRMARPKAAGKESAPAALLVDVQGLEMRVRNVYTGTTFHAIPILNRCLQMPVQCSLYTLPPLTGGPIRTRSPLISWSKCCF